MELIIGVYLMKKISKIAGLLLAMSLMGSAFASGKKDAQKSIKIGTLSFLNLSEKDYALVARAGMNVKAEMEKEGSITRNIHHEQSELGVAPVVYYDTLDSMIMALESGEIYVISGIPSTTANYLCNRNEKLESALKFTKYMPDIRKENSFSANALSALSNGFSFMMLEKNKELRDEFDKVIKDMKVDGTIGKLVRSHIIEVMRGKEASPVVSEFKKGRKTIKVAVTGSLPPMDYVAPDGTFAGFNTALLAEIGKRLDRNISMIQVSSVGRAAALASGTVDVVFWTRTLSETSTEKFSKSSTEDIKNEIEASLSTLTPEQKDAVVSYKDAIDIQKSFRKDMPENTIITIPYFTDMPVSVQLKK